MAITTYAELVSAVQSWLHRSDLATIAIDFVTMGEAHLNRALRTPDMEQTATVTASTSDRYASLPTRCREVLSLDYQGDALQSVSAADAARSAQTATTGQPEAYAVTSRFEFDRVPDSAYALTATYIKSLDLATDDTNWLLDRHPDAYLFSALVESAPFIRDDGRLQLWMVRRDQAVSEAASSEMRRRPSVLRTEVPQPQRFNIYTGAF